MTIERKSLRWNGWGPENQDNMLPDDAPQWAWMRDALGMARLPVTKAKPLEEITLAPCRLGDDIIRKLGAIVGSSQVMTDNYERAFHARGKSYHDLLYLRAGKLDMAPDAVVYPRNADEVLDVIKLASDNDITLIPFGGGSSVVGGTNAMAKSLGGTVITLDTTLMTRIIQIDKIAMTATIEAGIYGPALEAALQKHGVTLAHYPQSFQFSTLGGWIAARGAGQQSNRYGKAEKWLVSAKLATPNGIWTTEATPASAAGPNLNQIVAGSEGTLGVICEATVRIHEIPARKDYRGYLFKDFSSGVEAARRINHADIPVAMVRLSDAKETYFFQAFSSTSSPTSLKSRLQRAYLRFRGFNDEPCLMLIGHEGSNETVTWAQSQTESICTSLGAMKLGTSAGERWYHGRFGSPYSRDPMMDHGIGIDTLETSTRWSNIEALREKTVAAIENAIAENVPEPEYKGIVMAHVSHSYPDGASLYFTYVFPRQLDREVEQWQAIKRAASDVLLENKGTITHHHGVGVDHTPWLQEEKGAIGFDLLKTIKAKMDPKGVMNPGKLLG
jgi:alkyldihydroxyacetonephosphate synthase